MMEAIENFTNEFLDAMTGRWMLQPVRRCCKGSIPRRVAPAVY